MEGKVEFVTADAPKDGNVVLFHPAARLLLTFVFLATIIFAGTFGLLFGDDYVARLAAVFSGREGTGGFKALEQLVIFFSTVLITLGITLPLSHGLRALSFKMGWTLPLPGSKGGSGLVDSLPAVSILGSIAFSMVIQINMSNPESKELAKRIVELEEQLIDFRDEFLIPKEAMEDISDLKAALEGLRERVSIAHDSFSSLSNTVSLLSEGYTDDQLEGVERIIAERVSESYEDTVPALVTRIVEDERFLKVIEERKQLERPAAEAQALNIGLQKADYEYRRCIEPHRSFLFFVSSEERSACRKVYLKDVVAVFEELDMNSHVRFADSVSTTDQSQSVEQSQEESGSGQKNISYSRKEP